jgi:hypothetical protein
MDGSIATIATIAKPVMPIALREEGGPQAYGSSVPVDPELGFWPLLKLNLLSS